jgi:hypothetical protein
MPHLRFSGLIRRTVPFSRLYDTLGYVEDLFLPGSSRGRTVDKLFTVIRLAQKNFSVMNMESSPLPVVVRPAQEYFTYMDIDLTD